MFNWLCLNLKMSDAVSFVPKLVDTLEQCFRFGIELFLPQVGLPEIAGKPRFGIWAAYGEEHDGGLLLLAS